MKDRTEFSAWRMEQEFTLKYLGEVISVLAEYSWIYKTRNTDVFLYDVLEKIPNEWNEALSSISEEDLYLVPFSLVKVSWPSSLISFVQQCQRLGKFRFPSQNLQDLNKTTERPTYMTAKVSSKKRYEIEIMSNLVSDICQDLNCHVVLDIGSGLGYLDQVLHHHYGLQCIGIDSSPKYTVAAKERLKNDNCAASMKHHTMEVTYSEKCLNELKTILKDEVLLDCNCNHERKLPKGDIGLSKVMVGLHSCGNLTQDMMRLFCEMEEVIAFVCVGCCYNKIKLDDFPMSKVAKSLVANDSNRCPGWSPCVSGLRLASHGTRSQLPDSTRQSHLEKSMIYRALFEKYIKTENIIWNQPKRHIRSSDIPDFETYCRNMLKNHPLDSDIKTLEKLIDLYNQKKPIFPRITILLVLQTLLQPLWEGFVAVDRMLYFKENHISSEIVAMWDDSISSRNLALCAFKR